MNNTIRYMQNYLLLGFPFMLILVGWYNFFPVGSHSSNILFHYFWIGLSFNLIAWFICFSLFLLTLIIMPTARERALRRLANVQDRDEREELITGKASRATYFSTLSVMILLLFISLFSVTITHKAKAIDGHHYALGISLHLSLFNNKVNLANNDTVFDSHTLSLSSSSILLILISWQLLAFNLASRKEHLI